MKLHEYQAKALLADRGVPVPATAGIVTTPEAAAEAVASLNGHGVLKAQVHTGGRGKAGGIRLVESPAQAHEVAGQLLGSLLKTHQAPGGLRVERLLVEEPVRIAQEYYLAFVPDRSSRCDVAIASARGGMDIEQVAAEDPNAVTRIPLDPLAGANDFELRRLIYDANLNLGSIGAAVAVLRSVYQMYVRSDASLVEINPLAVTDDGRVLAADAKIDVDDSALFRHPELAAYAETGAEDPLEAEAARKNIAYVRLGGDIGIICNGAGLTMTTMDVVQRVGGRPADFLDVGGGAQAARVRDCLGIVLADPNVRGVLINIFGGITRCDEVARGVLEATSAIRPRVPIVVRLAGTRAKEGAEVLAGASLNVADTMQEAAQTIVRLTGAHA